MQGLTRRELLTAGAAAGAVLALRALVPRTPAGRTSGPVAAKPAFHGPEPAYRSVGDLYRRAWRWDRVVRGTHLRANCFAACSFDLYVKDGTVWREEQADVYARDAPGRSDFAPRGCQKGACYSSLMVGPDRLRHPLERVGPRGSGRWRRISWERALERLADAVLDAVEEGGPETVVFDNGTSNVDDGPSSVGEMRLFTLLGATLLDGFGGTGDLAMGAVQTWGTTFVDGTADDWMRADALLFWHCNPAVTRIPDAHFASEARYRGTRVVAVTPEYAPSAVHADLWVNPAPGSDAALALGLARVLLERGAVDEDYLRGQTDLPLLVCEDTKRFLRASDLERGGSEEVFYLWDARRGRLAEAPGGRGTGGSLTLGGLRPALAGHFSVTGRDGPRTVRPVLELLRERLTDYTPERVQAVTGIGPGVQARLAEILTRSRRALIYASWGSNKSYHADLLHRALILLSALRGDHGRPGGGVRFAAWLPLEGANALLPGARPSWLQRLALRFLDPGPRTLEDGIAAATSELPWTPSHLFLHAHAGLDRVWDTAPREAQLSRPPRAYLEEALARGWIRVRPAPDRPPRVLVCSGVNPLRRWPLPQVVEEVLWPKLRMVAVVDFRMSTTAHKADLVLPAAGYYEKRGIKYLVALAPYAVVGDRAVAPLGDSRGEWEICSRLARHVQERARARGIRGPAASLADRFLEGGRLGPDSEEDLMDRILRGSSTVGGVSWAEARRAGAVPRRRAGWGTTSGVGSEMEPGGTLSPSRVHVEGRKAWPTLTGRQQLYLDHPWFLEVDEALPRWKPLPGDVPRGVSDPSDTARPGAGGAPVRPAVADGAERPLRLGGGHTRWSVHAIWRGHPDLLRLQRGGPALWIAAEDARARGLRDGDSARVHNALGAFRVRVRVAPSLRPGLVFLDHAWEPCQFPGWRGSMEVVASPYKPLHLAGGYGHLRPRVFLVGPVHVPRNEVVEIEGLGPGRI